MAHAEGTVLLTGAAGVLGTWLRRTAPATLDVVPLTHRRPVPADAVVVDLRDRDAVAAALTAVRPDLVVHAGYAHDRASIVDATTNVTELAADVGAALVFVSTDAVFAGDGRPRSEAEPPDPIADYGRWKAEAEAIVSNGDPAATIARLSLITSVDPEDHILARIREGLAAGSPAVWFTDEVRRPAEAEELARAIWTIVGLPGDARSGVWHLPGPERLSRYEIAERAVAAVGLDPSSLSGAPTPPEAARPRDLHLTGERAPHPDRLAPVADLPVALMASGPRRPPRGRWARSGRRACGRGR